MDPESTPLGRQWLLDFHDCSVDRLADVAGVREAMLAAVRRSGATIVTETFRQFEPHGVSGVVVIAESHVAIHTWPEHRYAAVDLFTCGDSVDATAIRDELQSSFESGRIEERFVERGQLE